MAPSGKISKQSDEIWGDRRANPRQLQLSHSVQLSALPYQFYRAPFFFSKAQG